MCFRLSYMLESSVVEALVNQVKKIGKKPYTFPHRKMIKPCKQGLVPIRLRNLCDLKAQSQVTTGLHLTLSLLETDG
jgi:hypothetical protein